MKFKVGDRVVINPKCIGGNIYNGVLFASSMENYKKEAAIITEIFSSERDIYNINIDGGRWSWQARMLLPAKIIDWRKEFEK